MQIYLVGGAIRDTLLGQKVIERDWVIIGATPEQLLKQNYQAVGKDFPVFLHPETKEEYALARTERKKAPGYYGFICDFNPDISLEQDLLRRDLTINAIAMDQHHQIIDPYNGRLDIQQRTLRHVSDAFTEDPVRVLRVARFMARFAHLGFTIAQETMQLMQQMVCNNELSYLVPERIWQEWHNSLLTQNPELFITTLHECGALKIIAPELDLLYTNNLLQLFKNTANLTNEPHIRFAALACAIKTNLNEFCQRLRVPKQYTHLALITAEYVHKIKELHTLTPNEIVQILEKTDAFRRPEIFNQLLIISDALNTTKFSSCWRHIALACAACKPEENQTNGQLIKQDLHAKRVIVAQQIKALYEK
jgi:tRNA nucleotidyltransferase (CCA-adding enzyme)